MHELPVTDNAVFISYQSRMIWHAWVTCYGWYDIHGLLFTSYAIFLGYHCIVCSSSIYGCDYPFGIFKLFLTATNDSACMGYQLWSSQHTLVIS